LCKQGEGPFSGIFHGVCLRLTLDEIASEGSFEDRRIIAGELLVYKELFLRGANDEGNDITQITKIMLALLDILVMGDLNT
jgi:hypothetical protein